MKVSNAQVRTIQFCALQGWPLSTATAAWGHLHDPVETRAGSDLGQNPTSPQKKLFCPKHKAVHDKAKYKWAHGYSWPHGLV